MRGAAAAPFGRCAKLRRTEARVRVAALAGGTGAAKLRRGLAAALDASALTVVVNTGDDAEVWGLRVSPDLDSVMYALAGVLDTGRGWGRADETFRCLSAMAVYGAPTWFTLGDRDLATHLVRTRALRDGQSLSAITAQLCRTLGVAARLLPMSDDAVRTTIRTPEGRLGFQEYFVRDKCQAEVVGIDYDGADRARPAPGVVEAIREADLVVVCPSNPVTSVGPIIAVRAIADALAAARAPVVGVSPIVGGAAVSGPAGALMRARGLPVSPVGIAHAYAPRLPPLPVARRDARGRTDRARRGATRSRLGGDARAGGQRTGARTRRRAARRGRQPRAHRGGGARASGGRASGRARVRHDSRRRAVRDRRRDPASRAGRRAGSARVRALAFRAGDQRRGPGPARRDAAHVRRAVVRESSGRRPRARPRAACRFAARPRARRRRAGRSGRAARGAGRDGQRATRRDVAVQRPRAAGRRAASLVTVRYEVIGIEGIGEVRPGDDVAALVLVAAARQSTPIAPGDLAVISQKIVSKAEGRLLKLTDVTPSAVAVAMASGLGRDARLVEVILRESRRVVRMDRGVLVTETHHGWVCANAGVDQSNVDAEMVALLPEDPDRSARALRDAWRAAGLDVVVIIADTFGRPWREGLTNIAIGVAGFAPLRSYLGERDPAGR